jgi:LPPG:FO 2-phospho-L-lactate transferase
LKVVALAGGVGGAKLAGGLAQCTSTENLAVIVNTGDDFNYLGLYISPDLDTVCYTLAGLANQVTGWGRQGETWNMLENLKRLGGPDWFALGDMDLATHLERTRRLKSGDTLSNITQHFCDTWGIKPLVLPMSDQPVATKVLCQEGELDFQEYFVHRGCEPFVKGFRFDGIETAVPAPHVIEEIEACDLVVLCPSNPWVSIDPILALPGVRAILQRKTVVAVSPLIGGKTVKGPAAKMYAELGIEPNVQAVAEHYRDFLDGLLIDKVDFSQAEVLTQWGIIPYVTDILMVTSQDRKRLAEEALDFGKKLMKGKDR